jgi:putative ABC transport system permease protein
MPPVFKNLIRHPFLNGAIVTTLALALTAALVVSGLIESFLLSPLPYIEDQDVLIAAEVDPLSENGSRNRVSWSMAIHLREHTKAFSQFGIASNAAYTVHTGETTEVAYIPRVSPELFPLLGTVASIGQVITESNAEFAGQRAFVLSDSLWRRRFGADPNIVGRDVRLDDLNATIVGVMPPNFDLPMLGVAQQGWVVMHPEQMPNQDGQFTRHFAFGKLAENTSETQAMDEVARLGAALKRERPELGGTLVTTAFVLRDMLLGSFQKQLWILLAMSALVLMVACLNSGALLLAQAVNRRREFAVRVALGAPSGRLLRQFWLENISITLLSALVAILLSSWLAPLLLTMLPATIGVTRFELPQVGPLLLLVATVAAALAAGLFALMPWLISRGLSIESTLRSGGRTGGSGFAGKFSRGLVSAQITVALALAIGASLLLQSSRELNQVDYGFPVDELFQFRVSTRGDFYPDAASRYQFFEQVRSEISRQPGVDATSLARFSFPSPTTASRPFVQEGDGLLLNETPKKAVIEISSPEIFETHDSGLLYGRFFNEDDQVDSPNVLVINANLAARFWPNENPVGKRVQLDGMPDMWWTVVGVVSDRWSAGHRPAIIDSFILPFKQATPTSTAVFVRSSSGVFPSFESLQRVVWDIDPDVSMFFENRVTDFYADSAWQQRFSMTLIGAFSLLAITLCAAGLYAVLAFAVASRARELGVRSALGASRADLQTHILRSAGGMIIPGLILGLGLAAVGARSLGGLLYNVPELSLSVYLVTCLGMGVVCFLAAWLPALRASRVDPIIALRSE